MRAHDLRQGREHGKAVRPTHFEHDESSRCYEHVSHPASKWDVDCFLKNGGSLFTRGTYLEDALMWFDDTEVVLEHKDALHSCGSESLVV